MKRLHHLTIAALFLILSLTGVADSQDGQVQNELADLTLEQALDLAFTRHPELDAARHLVEAAEGERIQLGLFPNPDLIWRAESTRSPRFFERAEIILGISQPLPIGGRTLKAGKLRG